MRCHLLVAMVVLVMLASATTGVRSEAKTTPTPGEEGGTTRRKELDCSKLYEIQTIGVTSQNNEPTTNPIKDVKPFPAFGCKVRLLALTIGVAKRDLSIIIIDVDETNKPQRFDVSQDGKYYPETEVYVGAGKSFSTSLATGEYISTPGQNINVGGVVVVGKSLNLEVEVAIGYNCSVWSERNEFCLPNYGVSGNGTFLRNRTCTPMMDDLNETSQVEVTACTIQPIMTTWLEWSRCEMLNDTEDCGANATRYRLGKDCHDNVTKSALPSEYCPYDVYHVRSCVKYCRDEHSWLPYLWTNFSSCGIFKPELQGNNGALRCGNGFQEATQNTCVAGPDRDLAEYPNFCPPHGVHIRNCYTSCGIFSTTTPLLTLESEDNSTLVTSSPFETVAYDKDAPLALYGRFEPVKSMAYNNKIKNFTATIASTKISFYIFLNKYVYASVIQAHFSFDHAASLLHAFSLYTTMDGDEWNEIETNISTTGGHVHYGWDDVTLLCGVKVTFQDILPIGSNITANKIKLDYHLPPQWSSWGNWTGGCTDYNCHFTNATWYRVRKCEHESKEVDAQHCIGQFYEVQQCKCPSLYQWDLSTGNFSTCIPLESYCGDGFEYRSPEKCRYNNTEVEAVDVWLCGITPIQARSCFKVCNESCPEPKSEHVSFDESARPLQIGNGENIIITKIQFDPHLNESLSNYQFSYQRKSGFFGLFPEFRGNSGNPGIIGPVNILAENGTIKVEGAAGAYFPFPIEIWFCAMPNYTKFEGDCIVECGNGTQKHSFKCRDAYNITDLPENYCAHEEKPKDFFTNCSTGIVCYEYDRWSNYTECFGECGQGGIKNRTRGCLADGSLVNKTLCIASNSTKFNESEFFEQESCYNYENKCYKWSNWTECGNGTQYKERKCLEDSKNGNDPWTVTSNATACNFLRVIVDHSYLLPDGKIEEEIFTSLSCYEWGEWSKWMGAPPCGNGTQSKVRKCFEYSNNRTNPWTVASNATACNSLNDTLGGIKTQMFTSNISCTRWSKWGKWSASPLCGQKNVTRKRNCVKLIFDSWYINIAIKECIALGGGLPFHLEWKTVQSGVICTDPVSPWTPWGSCTRPCNGGQIKRKRTCLGDMDDCRFLVLSEVLPCNEQPCAVHGYWSNYTDWTPCSVSCGTGTQQRQRTCTLPKWNGLPCPGYTRDPTQYETRSCTAHMDCAGILLTTKSCSALCDKKNLTCAQAMYGFNETTLPIEINVTCRSVSAFSKDYHPIIVRSNITGQMDCEGFQDLGIINCDAGLNIAGAERVCNCINPEEEFMGYWSIWGECSVTCNHGRRSRSRELVHNSETRLYAQLEHCSLGPCPVDGAWSAWSGYDACNVTCGSGYRQRWRTCDNPIPKHGGANCSGTNMDMEKCGDPAICPIHGQWSDWEIITDCTSPCKWDKHDTENVTKSMRKSRRQCNNPIPQFGGDECKVENGIVDLLEEECTDQPQCQSATVNVLVELLDEQFDVLYTDFNSTTSLRLQEKITENVKELYKFHQHGVFNPQFFKIHFYGLTNGTGEGLSNTKP